MYYIRSFTHDAFEYRGSYNGYSWYTSYSLLRREIEQLGIDTSEPGVWRVRPCQRSTPGALRISPNIPLNPSQECSMGWIFNDFVLVENYCDVVRAAEVSIEDYVRQWYATARGKLSRHQATRPVRWAPFESEYMHSARMVQTPAWAKFRRRELRLIGEVQATRRRLQAITNA